MTRTISHRSFHLDGTFWGEPTKGVLEYEQEHIEGPHMAKFVLKSGENGVTDAGLKGWFKNRLMTEFATTFDGIERWRGYVWEMELDLNGKRRVKSMAKFANAVKTRYTNTEGDSIHTGFFVESDASIERYGRKEKIVTSSSSSGDEAEERAEAELRYSSSPYTSTIIRIAEGAAALRVTLAGRKVLANNILLIPDTLRESGITDVDDPLYGITYNAATTVSEEIRRIALVINNIGGWIYPLDIAENDMPTVVSVTSDSGAFDRIVELARLRDSDGRFYRLTVTNDGGLIYRPYDEQEDYIHYPGSRGLQTVMGDIPTWEAKSGFIRDLDDQSGIPMPDTWLNDAQLSFYERTVMRDGGGIAEFHGKDLDPADIYGAVDANWRRLHPPREKTKEEPKKPEGGNPWDWRLT